MNSLKRGLFFLIVIYSCQTIPQKPDGMDARMYEKYERELKTAYEANDYYGIGLAKANLGESPEKVFKLLNKSVDQNLNNCERLLYFNKLYVENGFKVVLVKLDTIEWKKICDVCYLRYGESEINNRFKQDSLTYVKSLKDIDSTVINQELVSQLKVILEDDQRYRKELAYITKENQRKLWSMRQDSLDDINLRRIEPIIDKFGIPSVDEVTHQYKSVVWLVLQHQSDIDIRDKYYPFLEDQCEKGNLSNGLFYMYKLYSVKKGSKLDIKL